MNQRSKLRASLLILVLPLVAAELCVRLAVGAEQRATLDRFRRYLLTGEIAHFEARAYTNYQRPLGTPGTNAFGFTDGEWKCERTPGVARIVCLGSSTTEGGNPLGTHGAYPYLLEQELERRTGRDFEVFNAGIASWTSAEQLVSWFLSLQDLDPDVLVLHEAAADLEPRFRADFRPDYSHWRRVLEPQRATGLERWLVGLSDLYLYLETRGEQLPDIRSLTSAPGPTEPLTEAGTLPYASSLPFRRNVLAIARAARGDGSEVVLMTVPTGPAEIAGGFWRYGIAEHNQHLRELCAEHGFLLADAARAFEARVDLASHFIDLVHLDPDGNRAKAELVADTLAPWLDTLAAEGVRRPAEPQVER